MDEKTMKKYYRMRNRIDICNLQRKKGETSLQLLRREIETRIEYLNLCMHWLLACESIDSTWVEIENDLFRDIEQAKYFLQLIIDVSNGDKKRE